MTTVNPRAGNVIQLPPPTRKNTPLRFTKTALNALPTPSRRTRIKDQDQTGLVIRLGTDGSKVFYFRRFWKGRMLERRIGTFGEWTIEQARKKAAEMQSDLNQGVDPTRKIDEAMTLGELYRQYDDHLATLITRKERSQGTRNNTVSTWNKHLRRRIAGQPLRHFDQDEAKLLLGKIRKSCPPSTHNHAHGLLTSMFNFAHDELGLNSEHPIRGIKRTSTQARERILKSDEVAAFFAAVNQEPEVYQDLVYSFVMTGQRKSMVLCMEWGEIDLERRLWTIPRDKVKTKKIHTVPLVEDMVEILSRRQAARKPGARWVFPSLRPSTGHVSRGMGEFTYWRRITERAGLWSEDPSKRLTIHDLRRTMGSWQAMEGVGLLQIAKTLGHANIKTTQKTYAHLLEDGARGAMEKAVGAIKRSGGAVTDRIEGFVEGLSEEDKAALLRRLSSD